MSDRGKITLEQMQEHCKKARVCEKCEVRMLCPQYTEKPYSDIDLTDPPRFTEAQMAFWKQWIAWGARYAMENKDFPHIIEFMREGGMSVGKVFYYDVLTGISLNKDETLDLAELLGKDAT